MFIVVTLIILLGDAGNPKSLRARKGKFYFIYIFEYAKLMIIEETHKNVVFHRLLVFICLRFSSYRMIWPDQKREMLTYC